MRSRFQDILSRNRQDGFVCVEVSRTHLRMAYVRRHDGATSIVVDEVCWRVRSPSLLTDQGVTELKAGFEELVARHDIRGRSLRVALNGDLCVTRIAIGDQQQVDLELDGFEERAQRYLTLGHGHKIHAAHVEPMDAVAVQGTLAVANQLVVEAIQSAAGQADLSLEGIEPSIVSISRLVGRKNPSAAPILLACLDGEGLEFGIARNGIAMAQFRPTKGYNPEQLALAMSLHLPRLKRQCSRHMSQESDAPELSRMLIVGSESRLQRALANLSAQEAFELRLDVESLTPECEGWDVSAEADTELDGRYGAALGLAALADEQVFGPNLLASLDSCSAPGWQTLMRRHWAAALIFVVALGFRFGAVQLSNEIDQLTYAQESSAGIQGRIAGQRLGLARLRNRIRHFQSLDKVRNNVRMSHLAGEVGMCLPESLWLTNFKADAFGDVTLRGASQRETSIYQALDTLRAGPTFGQVTINTTSASDSLGLVTFEMRGLRTAAEDNADEKK